MKIVRNDYCVYCHTTPSNRKYVGISCSPEKRWNNGRGYSHNYLFARAINKYGWENIKHEILFSNLTVDEAKKIEKDLTLEWKLTDPKYGYNLCVGCGNSPSEHSRMLMSLSRKGNNYCKGRVLSSSTKSKISKSLREHYKGKMSPFYGRHHSEETIQLLKNRIIQDETRAKMRMNHHNVSGKNNPSARPIRQLTMDGELVCEYEYAKQAATKYNLDLSTIIKCCKGKCKSCGGYRWEYL